ncbi:MAG: chloride channel protein [Sphaerochaetaceae bacterium]|nr:chloride channel protein [Sphaerochaetaceae bacterium]MDC7250172.1 chloride channel protein [Sphaerochaetaceae bacterium]
MPKKDKRDSKEVFEMLQDWRVHQIRRTAYIGALCILVGLISGIGSVGFRYLINFFYNMFFQGTISFKSVGAISNVSRWGKWVILVPALSLMLANFITEKWAPEAKGHGVPEVMDAVSENGGKIRPIVALVKIFASAITIGGGGSVGREGPIVQIGSSFGSSLGQFLKLSPREIIILVGAGAAGGIGATFNAPIGGVMFALELILPEYSIMTIMPLVISSIVSTHVASIFLGASPAFIIPAYAMISTFELIFHIILGIAAGLVSVLFIKSVYGFEDFVNKIKINTLIKSAIGGILIGILGYISFRLFGNYFIFGVGYEFMDFVLANKATTLFILLFMVVIKIVANSLTLSCGGSGGIFAPSLFLGSALGGIIGVIVNSIFPTTTGSIAAYALVGMVGLVSGVTGGVLTAIIMLFEMTRNYEIMLPVMLCAVISFFVAQLLTHDTMYTKKLSRRGVHIEFDKRISSFSTCSVVKVCKKDFLYCSTNQKVEDTLNLMKDNNLSILPVIADDNFVIGLIRYEKLYKADYSENQSIEDFVEKVKIVVPPSCNNYDALVLMQRTNSPILVIKDKKKIVGLVTMKKLLNVSLEKRCLT